MAFLSRVARALTVHSSPASAAASSVFQSRSVLARFYSTTLTSPKLFVSGLSRLTSDEKLHEAFAKFGNVVEAKVVTDRATQKSKGFGFVTYATIEDAEKAKESLNGTFLDGWVIFVDPAKPREQRPPPQLDQEQHSHTGFRVNKTVGWCG